MKLLAAVTVGFSLYFAALPFCQAEAYTPRFDRRQVKQEMRIQRGIESGQLTEREAQRLQNQQDRLQNLEDRVKADGVVTPRERVRLARRQNQASRAIYRKKHNLRRQ